MSSPHSETSEPRPLDVVGLGEVLVQLTPPDGSHVESTPTLILSTAGAESNVVSHLARMGHRAAMASAVGRDPWGRRVLRDLGDAGVVTSLVRVDPAGPTGLYLKSREPGVTRVHYHRAGSAASRMSAADAEAALGEAPRVLHTSGILPALSSSCDELAARLAQPRRAPTMLSFDVNHRPALWSAERAAPVLFALARASDIVFVGRDEANRLWGCRDDRDLRALLPEPRHLVVKDDDRAAVEWHCDQRTALRPARVAVRELVGAGDAFAAGWLSAFLDSVEAEPGAAGDATARLARGHRVAAMVLASLTDHPVDPRALAHIRREEMEPR